ncbi:MAG: contact-dependent growth inhibition system immunity protein [Cyanobacteria bacterium P01_A01_bin.3]
MNLSKSLEEIEGESWGHPTFNSYVVRESHRLRKVPLRELTAENLRFLIGQSLSLEYTVPIAINMLEKNILASGNRYIGDLLSTVAQVEEAFWQNNPELNNRLVEIKIEVESTVETLNEVLANLGAREFK